jgi:hypothetical protein
MPDLTPIERTELAECEAVIERGIKSFVEVGTALLKVRDGRLYEDDFDTFEAYCQERWGMSRRHANRLVASAEMMDNLLGPRGPKQEIDPPPVLPTSEKQVRPLTNLPAPVQREAWARAVETAPNNRPTARHVAAIAAEIIVRDGVPNGTYHAPLEGQASFLDDEEDEEDDPEEVARETERETARRHFAGIRNSMQKMLGFVMAYEEHGLEETMRYLSPEQKGLLAEELRGYGTRILAWADLAERSSK